MNGSSNTEHEARGTRHAAGLQRPADLCPLCSGTGYRPADGGVIPCHHDGVGRDLASRRGGSQAAALPGHEIPISAHELRHRIDAWLAAGRGPTNESFNSAQRKLLELLAGHFGQARAISLDHLARQLENAEPGGACHRVTDRFLKQLVHDLRVTHGIKVGSLRGWKRQARSLGGKLTSEGPRGYFLCLTPQDVLATVGTRLHEALATLEVLDALTDGRAGLKRLVSEARGQFRLFERSTS